MGEKLTDFDGLSDHKHLEGVLGLDGDIISVVGKGDPLDRGFFSLLLSPRLKLGSGGVKLEAGPFLLSVPHNEGLLVLADLRVSDLFAL